MIAAREATRRRHAAHFVEQPEPPVEHEAEPFYRNIGPAEVVPGYQLANILRAWLHQSQTTMVDLAVIVGVDEKLIRVLVNCEREVVDADLADKILVAIDRLDLWNELQTLPSPHWSLEKWISYMRERGCCDYEF